MPEHKFDISRKDLLYVEPERTKKRLTIMADMGMEEVGVAEFGFKGKMSGLYIERVWRYSDKDFDDYMEWAKTFSPQQ